MGEKYQKKDNQGASYRGTKGRFWEGCAQALALSAFALLCLCSSLWMVQGLFLEWRISGAAKVWIVALVVLTSFACTFFPALASHIGIKSPISRRQKAANQHWPVQPDDRRERRLRRIGAVAAAVLYGGLFFHYIRQRQVDFEDGSCAFAVEYIEKWNQYMKRAFYIWAGKAEFLEMAFSAWVIMLLLALLLAAVFFGKRFLLLLLPSAVLAALLMVGCAPGWKGTASFFAALFCAFAGESGGSSKSLRVHSVEYRYGRTSIYLVNLLSILCLAMAAAGVLAVSGALFRGASEQLLQYAPGVKQFQKAAEQKISGFASGLFSQRTKKISNQAPVYTGKEMLKITASKVPQMDVYLRGFYGTDYEDGNWVYDGRKFADACSREGYSQKQAAEELIQAGYDSYAAGRLAMYGVSSVGTDIKANISSAAEEGIVYQLQYTGIYDRYAYPPYFTNPLTFQDASSLEGDFLVRKERGKAQFQMAGWNWVDLWPLSLTDLDAPPVFRWYNAFAKSAYLAVPDCVPSVSDDMWPSLKEAKKAMLGDRPKRGANALNNRQERLLVASTVCSLLQENFSYSLDLEPLPEGMDAVDYFLSESKEGFCIHFASAVVFLMRKYGIPARYVSGYVARKEDFKRDGEQFTASVKDADAHAWAEIFLDDIGWVPVDATPGGGRQAQDAEKTAADDGTVAEGHDTEEAKELDSETEDSKTEDSKTEDSKTEDSKADHPKETDHTETKGTQAGDTGRGGGLMDRAGRAFSKIRLDPAIAAALRAGAIILFFILLLFLAWRLIRRAVKSYQDLLRRELRKGKYRKAVLRLNRRVYRRMCLRGGIRSQNLTDAEYGKALQAAYREISPQEWERFMRVAKEAAFAKEQPGAEDAYFCYRIYCQACQIKE